MEFIQKSYDRSDQIGKNILRNFLQEHNYILEEDKEDFFHDVIGTLNGEKWYFEVEVKNGFPFTSHQDFKFNSVSFLGRKKRMHDKHPFWYVLICTETGYAVMCYSNIIYQEKYRKNIYIDSRERAGYDTFYRLPLKYCTFFKIR